MTGKYIAPISPETWALLTSEEQMKFFEVVTKLEEKTGLNFKPFGPDFRSVTEKLPDGKLRVTYQYPLDNNHDRSDGRLYLLDSFTFDYENRAVGFHRDLKYNGKGRDKEQWRTWRAEYLNAGEGEDPQNKKYIFLPPKSLAPSFGRAVAQTFARPFTSRHQEILQKAQEATGFFDPAFEQLSSKTLTMKLGYDRTHYTMVQEGPFTKLVFYFVIKDDDPETKGHMLLKETFTLMNSAPEDVIGYKREWLADPLNPEGEGWEALAEEMNAELKEKEKVAGETGDKVPEHVQKFIGHFLPEIIAETPDFKPINHDLVQDRGQGAPEPSFEQFEGMLRGELRQEAAIPVHRFGAEVFSALGETDFYSPLEFAVNEIYEFDPLDPPLDIHVDVQGEKTFVDFYFTFGEESFDGRPTGQLIFKERYEFQDQTLVKIDRTYETKGPDPEGKFAAAQGRLKGLIEAGAFPSAESDAAKEFVAKIMPHVAPQTQAYGGGTPFIDESGQTHGQGVQRKLIDLEGLPHLQRLILEGLGKIQKGITPLLQQTKVEPRLRVQFLRLLQALQYNDKETALKDIENLSKAEMKAAKFAMAEGNHQEQQVHLDRLYMFDAIIALDSGNLERAQGLAQKISTPGLQRLFSQAIGDVQREGRNAEGLQIMAAVALDRLEQREKESKRWYFGDGKFDAKHQAKIIQWFFEKVEKQGLAMRGESPFAILRATKNLTEAEEELRKAILADPLMDSINQISQTAVKKSRGKQYFLLAKEDLFENKLLGSAQLVAQKVVGELLPKSRGVEGVEILEQVVIEQYALRKDKETTELLKEKIPDLLDFIDPKAAQKISPEKIHETLKKYEGHPALKTAERELWENELYLNLAYGLQVGERFFKKFQVAAQQTPHADAFEVLGHLRDLEPAEENLRKQLLSMAPLKKLTAAGASADPAERRQAYQSALGELQKDPRNGFIATQLFASIHEEDFPRERAAEGLALLAQAFALQTGVGMNALLLNQLIPHLLKEAAPDAEIMKETALEQAALEGLFARAKVMALSHPDQAPLAIIGEITDEFLDRELAQLKEKNPKPDDEVKKLLEIHEELLPKLKKMRDLVLKDERAQEIDGVLQDSDAKSRFKKYQALIGHPLLEGEALQEVAALLLESDAKKREEKISEVVKTRNIEEKIAKTIQEISAEPNEEGRAKKFGAWVESPDFMVKGKLREQGLEESAVWLDQQLRNEEFPIPSREPITEIDPQLMEEEKEQIEQFNQSLQFPSQVTEFLRLFEGKENTATTIAYRVPEAFHEVLKPTSLNAMFWTGLGGPFVGGRIYKALQGVRGARLAAGIGAGITGGLVFELTHKTGNSFAYTPQGEWENWKGDLATSVALFNVMHAGAGVSKIVAENYLWTGRWGKAFGRMAYGEAGTGAIKDALGYTRAMGPATGAGVPTPTRLGNLTYGLMQHNMAYWGMLGVGYGARTAKWQPEDPNKRFIHHTLDTGAMYGLAIVGFKVTNFVTGGYLMKSIYAMHLNALHGGKLPMADPTAVPPRDMVSLVEGGRLPGLRLTDVGRQKEVGRFVLEAETEVSLWSLPNILVKEGVLPQALAEKFEVRHENGRLEIRDNRTVIIDAGETLLLNGQAVKPGEWTSFKPGDFLRRQGETKEVAIPKPPDLFKHDLLGKIRFRRENGRIEVLDPREGEIPDSHGIALGVEILPRGEWVAVNPGDVLSGGGKKILVEAPQTTEFYRRLSLIPRDEQMSLVGRIERAKDLKGLQAKLSGAKEGSAQAILSEQLEGFLKGETPLNLLPPELKFRARVRDLMKKEVAQLKREGFTPDRFEISIEAIPEAWTPLEVHYHVGRQAKKLARMIGEAPSWEALQLALQSTPVSKLEGIAVEHVAMGLRIHVLSEHLGPIKQRREKMAERIQEVEALGDQATAEQQSRLATDREILQKSDEAITAAEQQIRDLQGMLPSNFRLPKAGGFLQKIKNLTEGPASEQALIPEKADGLRTPKKLVEEAVRGYLNVHTPPGWQHVQVELRKGLDELTPPARKMYLRSIPRVRSALLDGYFGPSQRREVETTEQAFRIGAFLGWAGLPHEVQIYYRGLTGENPRASMEVKLGDPRVSTAFSGLPLLTSREASKNPKDILFNGEEAADLFQRARAHQTASANPVKGLSPIFKLTPEGNLQYRTWMMSSQGASRLTYTLRPDGVPAELEIQYTSHVGDPKRFSKDPEFRKTVKHLQDACLAESIKVEPVSRKEFYQGMPFKIDPPGMGQRFSRARPRVGLPVTVERGTQKMGRYFEKRRLKKEAAKEARDAEDKKKFAEVERQIAELNKAAEARQEAGGQKPEDKPGDKPEPPSDPGGAPPPTGGGGSPPPASPGGGSPGGVGTPGTAPVGGPPAAAPDTTPVGAATTTSAPGRMSGLLDGIALFWNIIRPSGLRRIIRGLSFTFPKAKAAAEPTLVTLEPVESASGKRDGPYRTKLEVDLGKDANKSSESSGDREAGEYFDPRDLLGGIEFSDSAFASEPPSSGAAPVSSPRPSSPPLSAPKPPRPLNVTYKSESLEKFVMHYGSDFSPEGFFIRSDSPFEVGTPVDFHLKLANGSVFFQGKGWVDHVSKPDPAQPGREAGMQIRFANLSGTSQKLLSDTSQKILDEILNDALVPSDSLPPGHPSISIPPTPPTVPSGPRRTVVSHVTAASEPPPPSQRPTSIPGEPSAATASPASRPRPVSAPPRPADKAPVSQAPRTLRMVTPPEPAPRTQRMPQTDPPAARSPRTWTTQTGPAQPLDQYKLIEAIDELILEALRKAAAKGSPPQRIEIQKELTHTLPSGGVWTTRLRLVYRLDPTGKAIEMDAKTVSDLREARDEAAKNGKTNLVSYYSTLLMFSKKPIPSGTF